MLNIPRKIVDENYQKRLRSFYITEDNDKNMMLIKRELILHPSKTVLVNFCLNKILTELILNMDNIKEKNKIMEEIDEYAKEHKFV